MISAKETSLMSAVKWVKGPLEKQERIIGEEFWETAEVATEFQRLQSLQALSAMVQKEERC